MHGNIQMNSTCVYFLRFLAATARARSAVVRFLVLHPKHVSAHFFFAATIRCQINQTENTGKTTESGSVRRVRVVDRPRFFVNTEHGQTWCLRPKLPKTIKIIRGRPVFHLFLRKRDLEIFVERTWRRAVKQTRIPSLLRSSKGLNMLVFSLCDDSKACSGKQVRQTSHKLIQKKRAQFTS